MRTDMKYRLTLASVIALVPLALTALYIFIAFSNSIFLGIFPLYILTGAFVLTFILSFVPFMKDHMWLSISAVMLLSGLSGLILWLVI
ncbi:MAG: hypothetical protein J6127_08525 [Clostridiales bacterium]|nr:hypothetical protein [Clostridiales bacterium]